MIEMLSSNSDEDAQKEKETLQADIINQLTEGIIDLGAPILGAMTGTRLLFGDPIPYAPPTSTYGHGVKDNGGLDYAVKDGEGNLWDEKEDILEPKVEEEQ
jgi:hypothetical protein